MTDVTSRLVLLIGVRPRSGTNYVGNLLFEHPDCASPKGVWEGRINENLAALERTVLDVAPSRGSRRGQVAAELRRGFGESIARAMLVGAGDPPFAVIKTPNIGAIQHLRAFLPAARVVVLVRDGRAVAESARRTFGAGATLPFEAGEWSRSARALAAFLDSDTGPHTLLRYEDVVQDPAAELRRAFTEIGLDPDAYDYDAARVSPIRGSSTFRGDAGTVHWNPIPQDAAFQPLGRAAHWPKGRRRRFDAIAGPELERFGYDRSDHARTSWTALADGVANALDKLQRWRRAVVVRSRPYRTGRADRGEDGAGG